jgi:hypothetical protein
MTSQMPPLRWGAIGLAALAFVLMLLVQFVPFGGFTTDTSLYTAEADAYAWEAKFRADGFGEEASEDTSWYDNDFDDDDGIGKVRAGAPLLLAGAILALVAALAPLRLPMVGAAAAGVAAIVTGLAVYLMAKGIGQLFDDQQRWDVGFYFAVIAAVLAAVAGVLGFLSTRKPTEPAAF